MSQTQCAYICRTWPLLSGSFQPFSKLATAGRCEAIISTLHNHTSPRYLVPTTPTFVPPIISAFQVLNLTASAILCLEGKCHPVHPGRTLGSWLPACCLSSQITSPFMWIAKWNCPLQWSAEERHEYALHSPPGPLVFLQAIISAYKMFAHPDVKSVLCWAIPKAAQDMV